MLFEKLGSAALKKLACSEGIHSQLKKCNSSLFQIRAVLFDAAQKEIADESVTLWLDGLRDLAYDIDDVLNDLATKATKTEEFGASTSKLRKLVLDCCQSFSLSTRMKEKLDDITMRLQDLAEEKNILVLNVKVGKSKYMNRRLETSLVDVSSTVGRQEDEALLKKKLLEAETCDHNFSILPVVGMGGIGKTSLARILYNEAQVKDHFELKAWICVSDEFDIFKITEVIFQSVDGGTEEFADLNLLQVALREKLLEKRFLIVLDDVWNKAMRIGKS